MRFIHANPSSVVDRSNGTSDILIKSNHECVLHNRNDVYSIVNL